MPREAGQEVGAHLFLVYQRSDVRDAGPPQRAVYPVLDSGSMAQDSDSLNELKLRVGVGRGQPGEAPRPARRAKSPHEHRREQGPHSGPTQALGRALLEPRRALAELGAILRRLFEVVAEDLVQLDELRSMKTTQSAAPHARESPLRT